MPIRLLLLAPLVACGVSVRPICTTGGVTEVDDDEVTTLGFAADDALAVVVGEHATSGMYEDGTPIGTSVGVARGEGRAAVHDVEPGEERTPNGELFGTSAMTIHVACEDTLVVPVVLTVATDDALVDVDEAAELSATTLDALGVALEVDPDALEGLPAVEETASYGFLEASFESDLGMTGGQAGWGGETSTSSWARYVLTW